MLVYEYMNLAIWNEFIWKISTITNLDNKGAEGAL